MQPAYSQFGDWRQYPNATEVLGKVFFVGVSPTITSEMMNYVEKVVNDFVALD
jgi:dTDP-4-amino-4,6-dideoxygalactose transaminase